MGDEAMHFLVRDPKPRGFNARVVYRAQEGESLLFGKTIKLSGEQPLFSCSEEPVGGTIDPHAGLPRYEKYLTWHLSSLSSKDAETQTLKIEIKVAISLAPICDPF